MVQLVNEQVESIEVEERGPTPQVTSPLSIKEQDQLARHERVIERGFTSIYDMGQALFAINEKRLYRAYGTWKEYVEQRWEKTRDWAYKAMKAADVYQGLRDRGVPELLPEGERAARAIAPLLMRDPDAAIDVLRRLGPHATAAEIQAEVEEAPRPPRTNYWFGNHWHDAGSSAVATDAQWLVKKGLIEPSDLEYMSQEARATFVHELTEVDREHSIEWRDEHPTAFRMDGDIPMDGDNERGWRISRSLIRRRAREVAAMLQQGKVKDLARVKRLFSKSAMDKDHSHRDACAAFLKSLDKLTRRIKRGDSDSFELASWKKRHAEIRSRLDQFVDETAAMNVAFILREKAAKEKLLAKLEETGEMRAEGSPAPAPVEEAPAAPVEEAAAA